MKRIVVDVTVLVLAQSESGVHASPSRKFVYYRVLYLDLLVLQ